MSLGSGVPSHSVLLCMRHVTRIRASHVALRTSHVTWVLRSAASGRHRTHLTPLKGNNLGLSQQLLC